MFHLSRYYSNTFDRIPRGDRLSNCQAVRWTRYAEPLLLLPVYATRTNRLPLHLPLFHHYSRSLFLLRLSQRRADPKSSFA